MSSLLADCLAELAQIHGASKPEFDDQGFARIPTANGLTFEMYHPEKSTQLIVFILLGEVPQKNRTNFLLEALRANMTQHRTSGSVLAFHEEENLLTVQQRRNCDTLDPVHFQQAMRHLKGVADFWRAKLEQFRRQDQAPAEPPANAVSTIDARLQNLFA